MQQAISDDLCLISDGDWQQMRLYLPPERSKPRGGRPRMADRQAMEAILFVARTRCHWRDLPRQLGAPSTVHDRFREWWEDGVFARLGCDGLVGSDELARLQVTLRKAPLEGVLHRVLQKEMEEGVGQL